MNKYNNLLLIAAACIAGFLGSQAAASVSAHGGDTARIHGCVNPSSGEIKIVDANATCPSTHWKSLDWNIQGPPGPPGTSAEQLVKEFVVAPGENISAGDVVSFINNDQVIKGSGFGSEAVFNSADSSWVSAVALSPTQFVVAYSDLDNSRFGTAVIGTVSGNTVTFGPETVFNTDSTDSVSVAALSSTQFAVAYVDSGNSNLDSAVIGTVSGDTITFGPETVFSAGFQNYAVGLSATQFVVVYRDGAVVGMVSGDTITFSSEIAFGSGSAIPPSVAALSPTQFVVAYGTDGTNPGAVVIGTVSNNTITFSPEIGFPIGRQRPAYTSVAAISTTQFVIAYVETTPELGFSGYGNAIVGTISGNTITFGPKAPFNNYTLYSVSVARLSLTHFVVTYADSDNANVAVAAIGTISGNTISFGGRSIFHTSGTTENSVAVLSPTQFVVAYRDEATGSGTAVIGPSNFGVLVGTAKSAASGGESLPVIISGVSDVHSGLTPGVLYYAQPDGTLTTTFTGNLVGLALSPSEILLKASGN